MSNRIRFVIIVVTILATLVSIPGIRQLRFAGMTMESESETPALNLTLLSVPDTFVIDELKAVPGITDVFAPQTSQDLVQDGDSLLWRELTPADLHETLLWNTIFQSRDESHHLLYIKTAGPAAAEKLTEFSAQRPETYVMGTDVLETWATAGSRHDFTIALPVGLLLFFFVHSLLARSIRYGLVMWVVCTVPMVWVLAIMGYSGEMLSWMNILIPLQVLALATSYGIHVSRYDYLPFSERPRAVRGIVLRAAGTTAIGFATLLISSFHSVRSMGFYTIIGIVFSVLTALYTLPALMPSKARLPRESAPPIFPGLSGIPDPFRKRTAPLIQIVVILVVGLFATSSRVESFLDTVFSGRSTAGRSITHFTRQYGTVESLEISLDTGEQYGLTDPGEYRKVARLEEQIRTLSGTTRIIGPDMILSHAFGRLTGSSESVRPDTATDIGETMELLRSSPDPGLFGELVSPDYRNARILVWLASGDRSGIRSDTIKEIEDLVADSEMYESRIGGAALDRYRENNLMTRQFILSITIFLPAIILFLIFTERSLRTALVAVLPVTVGIIMYLGIASLFGVPLRIMSAVGIAFVLGVGVDDAIYVLRTIENGHLPPHAVRAVTETTLLVVLGVLVTLLTGFRAVHETGLLISVGLISATFTSLVWIPVLASGSGKSTSSRG